jgi:predicted double-glycine peptidase
VKQYDLVSQDDEWGCGAACMASLLGIPYQKAKQLVEEVKGRSINAKPYGLEPHHIAIALKE